MQFSKARAEEVFSKGYKKGSIEVVINGSGDIRYLYFYGSPIAKYENGAIYFNSYVTRRLEVRDRLNSILSEIDELLISEKDGKWFRGNGEIFKCGWYKI